jgi:oligopeptide/dipeptide ABC transporter ATP-binding protein
MALLEIRGLSTVLPTRRGPLRAVEDVSLSVGPGECLGIVGESGSGKSVTCRSLLGLLPEGARVTGEARFDGTDLLALSEAERTRFRGREIAMIVQDAVSALNPVRRIGDQISETMLEHGTVGSRAAARARALELMRKVGIPAAESRVRDYPHQFSGGMCQRVVIAAALAGGPRVLIADEPTTALDVTIQDQILTLLVELQRDLGLAVIHVTHDMGVVAQTCDRVAVMYAGQIVETATPAELFEAPRHPYTRALLDCVPSLDAGPRQRLRPIEGLPPDLVDPPRGCRFHPRCGMARPECRAAPVPLARLGPGRSSRCLRHADLAGGGEAPRREAGAV